MKSFLLLAAAMVVCCADADPGRRALFRAIAAVESSGGAASANIYQIQPEYVADVNRILRKLVRIEGCAPSRPFAAEDVLDRAKCERMMEIYWTYYGRRCAGPLTDEIRAKLHRVGFRGLSTRRATADAYWRRVRKEMGR